MSVTLKPKCAVEIAQLAYDADTFFSPADASDSTHNFRKDFELNLKNGAIQGTTGIFFTKKTSGFAIAAKGKSPAYKDHHIFSFRGTDPNQKSDIATDLFISKAVGPTNQDVHGGFNLTFYSLKSDLEKYIRQENPKVLHCVGHSLGGAVAGLTAAWAQASFGIDTKLYTFGAPRIGLEAFARQSDHYIKSYRMTHGQDPVPCVPVWPFIHAGTEYLLHPGKDYSFSASAHLMNGNPGYLRSVANFDSFQAMESNVYFEPPRQRIILEYKNRMQVDCNSAWERKIRNAFISLLADAGYRKLVAYQKTAMTTMTFYDMLARGLEKIATMTEEYAERVKGLLGHMLAFVGQGMRAIKDLGYQTIRSIFTLMIQRLYRIAQEAINHIS